MKIKLNFHITILMQMCLRNGQQNIQTKHIFFIKSRIHFNRSVFVMESHNSNSFFHFWPRVFINDTMCCPGVDFADGFSLLI